jgi:hypothetical protein
MKFFKMIQATMHISNMAEESQVYFDLGKLVSSQKMINGSIYNHSIQQYFYYYDSLKAYLGSSLTEHNNACKFLAMFTAYSFGVEQRSYYDWKQVRVVAEGLWGSMYETPDIFILKNIPIIDISIQYLKEATKIQETRMQKLRNYDSSSNTKRSVGHDLAEQINNPFNDNEIVVPADVSKAISLCEEDLLQSKVPKSEIREIALELFNNQIGIKYSTHDLAIATALNFFKQDNMKSELDDVQLHARMKVLEWFNNKESINPILFKSFEDTLYKKYKP